MSGVLGKMQMTKNVTLLNTGQTLFKITGPKCIGYSLECLATFYNLPGFGNNLHYYSTIMSFYHIRSRERAKYEAVIHRSVLV